MYSSNIDIKTALAAISNHKPIAQKSTEWLAARKNLIAASEAGYLLGIRSTSSMINYIKGKCNISTSLDNLGMLDSIRHGNIYEDVSRAIYQSRHNVIVKEYGLITTSKHSFLGASPDGIVIQEHRSGDDKITESRIGRLVEIKNPYDYDPSDVIKPEYAVQILQQQFVLDLPNCDFVKTNIIGASVNAKTACKGLTPYRDIDAFLADVPTTPDLDTHSHPHPHPHPLDTHPIENNNIPASNMTSKGMEKGIIIHYKDSETGQSITNLYPLDTPYTKADILEWIKTTKETISSNTGICKSKIAVEYWYLAAYFEKVIEYDSHLFENIYLPRLELVWQLITRIRQLQALYSSELIINFIDNILKPHINKPSAFYKLPTNQMDIYNILETALQLDVKSNSNADNEKSKGTDKSSNNEKSKSSAKTPRAPKTKVVIEYDF